jgi:hypothetical protein
LPPRSSNRFEINVDNLRNSHVLASYEATINEVIAEQERKQKEEPAVIVAAEPEKKKSQEAPSLAQAGNLFGSGGLIKLQPV